MVFDHRKIHLKGSNDKRAELVALYENQSLESEDNGFCGHYFYNFFYEAMRDGNQAFGIALACDQLI